MAEAASRQFFLRVGFLIVASTALLTASFVGVLAFVSGGITGVQGRIPWYLVVAATTFVSTIVLLEAYGSDGRMIMLTSVITTTITLVFVPLAVEGLLFASRRPEKILGSQLVLYFVAAGLIGTGLGYWGLKHWREFTAGSSASVKRL